MSSYLTTHGRVEVSSRRHTWTDKQGDIWSVLDLGDVSIIFGSADEARDVAARCLEIAGEIDAMGMAEAAAAAAQSSGPAQ